MCPSEAPFPKSRTLNRFRAPSGWLLITGRFSQPKTSHQSWKRHKSIKKQALKLKIAKLLHWDPASQVHLGKNIPDFFKLMERYIIKYNYIGSPYIIPPDELISVMQKIQEACANVGALEHLVHAKALGPNQTNNGGVLGLNSYVLCNGIVRALGQLAPPAFEMRAK